MIFKELSNYRVIKFKGVKEGETIILNKDIMIEIIITEIMVIETIVKKDGNMISFKEISILILEIEIITDREIIPIVLRRIEKLFFTDCFFKICKSKL